jgi:peptide/nickel transport system permease protein
MLETIRQDYIRTARSKGATNTVVIWKHALKNAMLPVVTVLGSNFGSLLGGAVLIETVFSLPGLGILVVNSIRSKDIPQVILQRRVRRKGRASQYD